MGAVGGRRAGWKRVWGRRSWFSQRTKRPPWLAGVVEPEPGLDGGRRGRLGTASWGTVSAASALSAVPAVAETRSGLGRETSGKILADWSGRGLSD